MVELFLFYIFVVNKKTRNMESQTLSKELSLDQAKIALDVLKTNGARSAELKLLEQIFSKNRTITRKYFLHRQRFGSRRPWAAPADLLYK